MTLTGRIDRPRPRPTGGRRHPPGSTTWRTPLRKLERNGGRELCVHRKGATRAFPSGAPDVPVAYRDVGQPLFIPGSMGTSSFVLVGLPGALERSFGSACHGAGRRLSRTGGRKRIGGTKLRRELERRGSSSAATATAGGRGGAVRLQGRRTGRCDRRARRAREARGPVATAGRREGVSPPASLAARGNSACLERALSGDGAHPVPFRADALARCDQRVPHAGGLGRLPERAVLDCDDA